MIEAIKHLMDAQEVATKKQAKATKELDRCIDAAETRATRSTPDCSAYEALLAAAQAYQATTALADQIAQTLVMAAEMALFECQNPTI